MLFFKVGALLWPATPTVHKQKHRLPLLTVPMFYPKERPCGRTLPIRPTPRHLPTPVTLPPLVTLIIGLGVNRLPHRPTRRMVNNGRRPVNLLTSPVVRVLGPLLLTPVSRELVLPAALVVVPLVIILLAVLTVAALEFIVVALLDPRTAVNTPLVVINRRQTLGKPHAL